MECPDEVVRRGFAGRIRAVRVVFCRFGEELLAVGSASAFVSVGFTVGFCELECPVDFVGGYVVKSLSLVISVPELFCRLEQGEGSHYICPCEGERILDRPVDMAFRCEVYDPVDSVCPEGFQHLLEVADVRLYEGVVRRVLDVRQVCEVPGIGQFVEVDDSVLGIFVDQQPYYMAADKTGSAGDE